MAACVCMGGVALVSARPARAEIVIGVDAGWLRHTSHGDGYDYLDSGVRVGGQLGLVSTGGFMVKLDVAHTWLVQSLKSDRPVAGDDALTEVIVLGGWRLRQPSFIVDFGLGADWSYAHRGSSTSRTDSLPWPRGVVAVRRPVGPHHSLGAEFSVTGLPGVDAFTTLSAVYEWGS